MFTALRTRLTAFLDRKPTDTFTMQFDQALQRRQPAPAPVLTALEQYALDYTTHATRLAREGQSTWTSAR